MNNKLYKDDQGNLVEVFSMTPTEVKFSNQGGGFLMRCSRQEFDSKFTPAAEPEYSCMVVTAEWLDQNLACYSNGKRWNGWGMPLFPFESAKLVPRRWARFITTKKTMPLSGAQKAKKKNPTRPNTSRLVTRRLRLTASVLAVGAGMPASQPRLNRSRLRFADGPSVWPLSDL